MHTQCTTQKLSFKDLGERRVEAEFSAERITTDFGGRLLREVAQTMDLFVECVDEERTAVAPFSNCSDLRPAGQAGGHAWRAKTRSRGPDPSLRRQRDRQIDPRPVRLGAGPTPFPNWGDGTGDGNLFCNAAWIDGRLGLYSVRERGGTL